MLWLFIVLSRLLESYRDAEIFNYPTSNRSQIWHGLKILQYAFIFVSGFNYYLICLSYGVYSFWLLSFSLISAFGLFEICLNFFRGHKISLFHLIVYVSCFIFGFLFYFSELFGNHFVESNELTNIIII